ncbi:UDP-glycosyltransferase UGT5-like isoform X2 [Cardiocondyla obscurior]|uniref:UDP-glycosyltransferase UGT5-like isoform X2 n=1 Tax=Cardiocondyla obscurior TaxID=286306 RepID=UPI0039655D95
MSRDFSVSFYFICCILINLVTASKPLSVLLLQNIPAVSHHIWAEHLAKELLRKGHHVHAVSIQEINIKGKLAENLTYSIFEDIMISPDEFNDFGPDKWEKLNEFYSAYVFYVWAIIKCEAEIKTETAKNLLELVKTVEFDVIVLDITMHQCFSGLYEIAKGKPFLVGLCPMGSAPWLKDFIGGPSYSNIRPYTSSVSAKPVGLWQKTWNTIYYTVDDLLRQYYYMPNVQRIAEEYIGHSIRPLHEIDKRIDIILINSHPTFESAIPLPPNTLEVGGMHVQPIIGDTVTCPEDIRMFLDEAKSGAIIISLGTNVKWKLFKADKIKAVILALAKLKQRVLWKLDMDVSFKIPNNIMIAKWIPQKEILSHTNVRAIWTHGGLLSTHEAIWKGVPMIVTPFFVDQKSNAEILVAKGVAIRLDFKTLTTQSTLRAIKEIFNNERTFFGFSYKKNIKRLSSNFRDRPISPLDLAVWSIEYTVRHPNGSLATSLRSQSWVEQNLIDVYAFLSFTLVIISLSVLFVIKLSMHFYYNCVTTKLRKSKQS